jgi:hypothetical protein
MGHKPRVLLEDSAGVANQDQIPANVALLDNSETSQRDSILNSHKEL